MFGGLEKMMITLLEFFYSFTQNYGWAIILVTASVKLVFYPLSKKQFHSMARMKEIQPKLKEIQAKHKKNPQQLQKEMMGLYKKEGINPLAGCLPLLVQIPFLIGLFIALNGDTFKEIIATVPPAHASFLWIAKLTDPDTLNLLFFLPSSLGFQLTFLPVMVGLSTFATQKMMGGTDPKTEKMMMFMPLLMIFISLKLPAGVLLYWVVSNFMTAAQQFQMQVKRAKPKPVTT